MERSFNIGLQWLHRHGILRAGASHGKIIQTCWFQFDIIGSTCISFVGKSSINGGHSSFPSILDLWIFNLPKFQWINIMVPKKNAIWKVIPHVQTHPCVFHRQLTGYTTCTIVLLHLLLHYFVSIISVHDFKWYHIVKNMFTHEINYPTQISYHIKTNHAYYVSNISRVYHYDPQLYSLNQWLTLGKSTRVGYISHVFPIMVGD